MHEIDVEREMMGNKGGEEGRFDSVPSWQTMRPRERGIPMFQNVSQAVQKSHRQLCTRRQVGRQAGAPVKVVAVSVYSEKRSNSPGWGECKCQRQQLRGASSVKSSRN